VASAEQAFGIEQKDKEIKIFFQDEGRFGRINRIYSCWCPIGIRPIVAQQMIREFIYAYSSVCPATGETFSLVMPEVNLEAMNIYLEEMSKMYRNCRIIIVLDCAGWHTSEKLKKPDNIRLISLPPRSPELNPAEHIWDYIREKFFKNYIFKTIEDVMDTLCKGLKSLIDIKDVVKSLTGFGWIF